METTQARSLSRTRRLTESGVMIALATVLSMLPLYTLPNGGSITVCSMVPIVLIAMRYDLKWSLFVGLVHGLLQLFLGINNVRGLTLGTVVAVVLLDYLLAFGVLGFAGIFRHVVKNMALAAALGSVLVGLLRFLCHFLSGWLIWAVLWPPEGMLPTVYSLTYNGSYMLPETIITAVVSALLVQFLPIFRKKTA